MALTGAHAPGATPLSQEDVRGLKIESITTQGELNEAEAANIIRGQEWALRSRTATLSDMLGDEYLQRLHVEMFGAVWKWAGEFRPIQTNIGVEPHRIRTDLRQLMMKFGAGLSTTRIRRTRSGSVHYRVVTIHPFRNGNGRHARMLAHIAMIRHLKVDPVPWRGSYLRSDDENQKAYSAALVEADNRNFGPLLEFARSK
jgi:Fic-DOC domain mobile mystery protein B